MDLVEDGEAAAVVRKERFTIGRPDQQVLEHHVVGQEDMRRVLPEPLPHFLLRRAVIAGSLHLRVP